MLPVVILAGGQATRLGELSEKIPKCLVPIAGEPFIYHQLRLLQNHGVEKVVICVGHLGNQVKNAVGDGLKFGLSVQYSEDGPNLLGTGGALMKALPLVLDYFMILYGDAYLEIDYRDVAKSFLYSGKLGLMTVYHNQNQYASSNVIFDGKLVRVYDKIIHDPSMEYIDYGINCLAKESLSERTVENFDLGEIFTELSINKQLAGYEVYERFYEVGSLEGIRDLEHHLASKS
jgi:NDP-sugar pyrophosphorylase family protein